MVIDEVINYADAILVYHMGWKIEFVEKTNENYPSFEYGHEWNYGNWWGLSQETRRGQRLLAQI